MDMIANFCCSRDLNTLNLNNWYEDDDDEFIVTERTERH